MEDRLSNLLEDFLQRRARGETVRPEDYRDRAGDEYAALVELLAAESALDSAMGVETDTTLPRTFGSYTLLKELGRGAAGVVYEALHRDLGRSVALKVLRTGFDTTPEALERFRREAVACAQVRHDHIVEVYEAGEEDGRPFYAMALLEGKSLSQLSKDGELPAPRDLCRELAGVAAALHTLHERGIVHRDVKPGNIMVEPGGRMVLADFGLARTMHGEALTQSGEALGTPLYMSPEQLMGRRGAINGRTDVYGLGATLYQVLANRPLFLAEDMAEMIRQILQDRPPSLRQVAPKIAAECDSIVMKAVEKENDDRYETAAAMRDDLLAFARGDAVAGRPVSGAVRGLRAVRRRWIPLAAAAVVLAALAVWYVNRPATLRVEAYPVAQVLIDGNLLGATPQEANDLAPGEHELTLRSGGFLERTQTLRLEAGELKTMSLWLFADGDNPAALKKLAGQFELAMAELEEPQRHRGAGPAAGVFPLFPRGDVRKEDLERYQIDVGPEFMQAGTLQFKSGGKLLHSEPFDPENLVTVAALPQAVRDAIDAGALVEWGFNPSKGDPVVTTFQLVTWPNAQLAEIEEKLADQDPRIVRHLRADVFLKDRLLTAAYWEARSLLANGKPDRHACAVLQAVLSGELENTPAWDRLLATVDELPREK